MLKPNSLGYFYYFGGFNKDTPDSENKIYNGITNTLSQHTSTEGVRVSATTDNNTAEIAVYDGKVTRLLTIDFNETPSNTSGSVIGSDEKNEVLTVAQNYAANLRRCMNVRP